MGWFYEIQEVLSARCVPSTVLGTIGLQKE